MRTVAVVGAGILGASAAWNLARLGARVIVLERASAPAMGTSATSFCRVSPFGHPPGSYFELNRAGLTEHHRLRAEGVPGFHPCATLVWRADPDRLRAEITAARGHGYAVSCPPTAQIAAFSVTPSRRPALVAYLPEEGWADLPVMAQWMLERARRHGADVRFHAVVSGVRLGGDGAVRGVDLESGARVAADVVLNAAGAQGDRVARMAGGPLPLAPTSGLLVELPLRGSIPLMLVTPRVSVRPTGPDSVQAHSDAVDARLETAPLTRLVADLTARAAALVPGLAGARPLAVRVGVRARPADRYSSVGFLATVPGYYEAVTHSGATLGPLLGRLAAEEITRGVRSPLLAPYSPDRFLAASPASR
ncbi:NAD(P)/FAD-dependent oxidoreductase [Streptomonospora nanhaiensis]|uniref:Glycine/D-amino acid oxidase-like deaminating enzyme n=1 Tax=Streptomonospora nanhaiensis TaxID=1323731 RepID=A0A853BK75_9ACTN|nr:FAD-dependent oxidoreductase [Streptomonospora nanhaiensis]MBV2363303.1 FAD-binding oxidoreductase [Streptomonospora nanhaiensis]MBX9390748.1 FAD-binding oxidoreductase [Streptomonospora nanhaiensis]NYI95663.1 glycine/D-amino acid oxidase-like deaminating enzyme [Streptomonospora nanhaiensis]